MTPRHPPVCGACSVGNHMVCAHAQPNHPFCCCEPACPNCKRPIKQGTIHAADEYHPIVCNVVRK